VLDYELAPARAEGHLPGTRFDEVRAWLLLLAFSELARLQPLTEAFDGDSPGVCRLSVGTTRADDIEQAAALIEYAFLRLPAAAASMSVTRSPIITERSRSMRNTREEVEQHSRRGACANLIRA